MPDRKSLSKKIRFEVFKRDSFTCQYCGKSAPDVVLEIDHINPVANGGNNGILNLITACYDCNRGKGKRLIDDNNEISKQKEQLDLMNEKRNQFKLLIKWKEELNQLLETQIDYIDSLFRRYNKSITEYGRNQIKNFIKKFGFEEVLESTEISFNQYYKTDADMHKVFDFIPKICAIRKRQKDDPILEHRMIIRKILKNKFNYIEYDFLSSVLDNLVIDLKQADKIKKIAMNSKNWLSFKETIKKEFEL